MTSDRRAAFTDALTGADGMADPPPIPWSDEHFTDALAAPTGDATPRITLPEVPVPPVTRQSVVQQLAPPQMAPPQQASAPRPAPAPVPVAYSAAPPLYDGPAPMAAMAPPTAPPMVPQAEWGASYSPPTDSQMLARVDALQARVAARAAHPAPRPRPTPHLSQPRQHTGAPRAAFRPKAQRAKKGSAGGAVFTILFVLVLLLISSGAGREILDVIADFLNQ